MTVRRGLFAFLGLLALSLSAALLFPQQVLCVDSGIVQADALVVLGGGSYERPIRAAELFRAGAAPRSKRQSSLASDTCSAHMLGGS
jgi:hypothetical protein